MRTEIILMAGNIIQLAAYSGQDTDLAMAVLQDRVNYKLVG